MAFILDEVRRLTGPNLLSNKPGAIADVLFDGVDAQAVLNCWQRHLAACREAVAWRHDAQSFYRFYEGGMSLSIPAPMDLLYSACDLLELAWDLCVQELSQSQSINFQPVDIAERVEALRQSIEQERNPDLLGLIHQADIHHVVCLADDDEVSLGTGPSSRTWPISQLPEPSSICWSDFQDVPLALITGTNGKSTSVRLAAAIAKAAGVNAGVTSTDFIKVGDTIIDEGDYSGPGGARMLLRDKRTEMAFLEVARGGLLRRGLPVKHATAALVTNVASDHLGQYGINTVDDIASVKIMVAKAISPNRSNDYLSQHSIASQNASDKKRILVLNADDERLAAQAHLLQVPICWFSPNANNPLIVKALANKLPCVFSQEGALIYSDKIQSKIAQISDVPMTINGTAMHNVQNALGVIGLCKAMNIDNAAIQAGLLNFASSAKDNPGRGNIYKLNGVTVIVDFAHNSHSMQAVIDMANKMPAVKKHVMFSHAGDRSDQDIKDVTNAVKALHPSTYVLAELTHYLRGRELGEISSLVKHYLVANGVSEGNLMLANDPLDGAKKALSAAQSGDLVLLFVLDNREQVQEFLLSQGAQS